jgi:hypothetical protein
MAAGTEKLESEDPTSLETLYVICYWWNSLLEAICHRADQVKSVHQYHH